MEIEISKIKPSPNNARKYFDKISELAEDIKINGLIQKISVRPVKINFEIIQGERRFRALELLGRKTIDCEIRDVSEEEAKRISLAENMQREDLSPIELANEFQKLLEKKTQKQLASEINKSQGYIAQTLRFLSLPEYAQELITIKLVSKAHGIEMIRFEKYLRMMNRDKDFIDSLIGQSVDYALCEKYQSAKDFHDLVDINIINQIRFMMKDGGKGVKENDYFHMVVDWIFKRNQQFCSHEWFYFIGEEYNECKEAEFEPYCCHCGLPMINNWMKSDFSKQKLLEE